MKRWRNHGAFLLTLALMAGPLAAGPGNQDGRGKGRAERVERAQQNRQDRAEHRAERRAERRGGRAEAANARGGQRRAERAAARERRDNRGQQRAERQQERRQEKAAQRTERRAERREASPAQRVEARRDRADRRPARVVERAVKRQEKATQRAERLEQRRDRATERRQERREERRGVERTTARVERPALSLRERVERRRAAEVRAHDLRQQVRVSRDGAARLERMRQRQVRSVAEQRALARRDRVGTPIRFHGLDRDGDGRIARREWRGNDVAFANHDWNRDGVLSGVEVVPGARRGVARDRLWQRDPRATRERVVDRWDGRALLPVTVETIRRVDRLPRLTVLEPVDRAWRFDENLYERRVRVAGFEPVELLVRRVDLTPIDRALVVERFTVLDLDDDRYVSYDEWTGPRPLFRDLDRDGDDLLVVRDFDDVRYVDTVGDADRERYVAFHLLDVDDDALVAPWEWTGDLDVFFMMDVDDDGAITLAEYLGLVEPRRVPLRTAFGYDYDLDDDGDVEAVEWYGDPLRFARLDIDADGELEPVEALVGWLFRA